MPLRYAATLDIFATLPRFDVAHIRPPFDFRHARYAMLILRHAIIC